MRGFLPQQKKPTFTLRNFPLTQVWNSIENRTLLALSISPGSLAFQIRNVLCRDLKVSCTSSNIFLGNNSNVVTSFPFCVWKSQVGSVWVFSLLLFATKNLFLFFSYKLPSTIFPFLLALLLLFYASCLATFFCLNFTHSDAFTRVVVDLFISVVWNGCWRNPIVNTKEICVRKKCKQA